MPDPQSQLDSLRAKRDQAKQASREKRDRIREAERDQVRAIDRRIRRAESRLRSEADRRLTRLKILAGAWVLHEADRDPRAARKLRRGLAGFLTKPRDRELAAEILGSDWDQDGGDDA